MRKLFDHMDHTFRSAYLNYEDEPSADVWERIKERLPQQHKRRTGFLWTKVIVIVAAAMMLAEQTNQNEIFLSKKYQQEQHQIRPAVPKNNANALSTRIDKNVMTISTHNEFVQSKIIEISSPRPYKVNDVIRFHTPVVALSQTGFSQANIPSPQQYPATHKYSHRHKPYWTISPVVSIGRAAYTFDSDLPANYQRMKQIRQSEKRELSFTAGMLATWNFRRQISLQTGLIYSITRIQIDPHKIYAFDGPGGNAAYELFTSSGYAYIKPTFAGSPAVGDSLYTTEVKHSFKSFSIPVGVKFDFPSRGKLSFHPGVSVSANLIIGSGLETEVTDAMNRESVTIKKLQGTNNFFWSAQADAEIQYEIHPSLSIAFRPSLSYALSSITDNEFVETFPYSFNAGLGINYKF